MLFVKSATSLIDHNSTAEPSPNTTLHSVLGVMSWRRRTILSCLLLFLLVGLIYVLVRPPSYTAQTNLLIYNTKVAFSREDALFAESQLDPTFLETQIQILKSDKISLAVIDHLGLANKFNEGGGSWLGATNRPSESQSLEERRQSALKAFQRNLSVERIGLSYVVNVAFTASDPENAANIANEVARAYVADQEAARLEAAQSASAWLRERIKDLGPRTRIIAQALPPRDKSNIRGLFVIAISGITGLAAGVAFAFIRELMDRKIRTPEQAVAATGAECLGIIPRIKNTQKKSHQRNKRSNGTSDQHASYLHTQEQRQFISDREPSLSYVIDQPGSLFWHTLRNVNVSLDSPNTANQTRCVGVTSALSGEGTSTIAANLARLLANSGARVLLIDLNHIDARLSNAYAPGANAGIIDLLESGGTALEAHLWTDPRTGMHFLPLGGSRGHDYRSSVLWSEHTAAVMSGITERYEYAVFDLPPLMPAADVRSAAEYLTHFLLVIAWNYITEPHLEVGLKAAGHTHAKLLGTVLNKVDMRSFRRLSSLGTYYFSQDFTGSRH